MFAVQRFEGDGQGKRGDSQTPANLRFQSKLNALRQKQQHHQPQQQEQDSAVDRNYRHQGPPNFRKNRFENEDDDFGSRNQGQSRKYTHPQQQSPYRRHQGAGSSSSVLGKRGRFGDDRQPETPESGEREKVQENAVEEGEDGAQEQKTKKRKRGGKNQREKQLKWEAKQRSILASEGGVEAREKDDVERDGAKEVEVEDAVRDVDMEKEGKADSERDGDEDEDETEKKEEEQEDGDEEESVMDDEASNQRELFKLQQQQLHQQRIEQQKAQKKQQLLSKTAGLPDWLRNPVTISPHFTQTDESSTTNPRWNLSAKMTARLQKEGITHFFPVQQAVLPRLLATRYSSAAISPGDLCVSASTGSGKTLAYVVPIVETLITRVIPRIRALVILPTRDLAAQVKTTFDAFVKGTDLNVALVTGHHSFTSEQQTLVSTNPNVVHSEDDNQYSSKVDILIATPGRLMDHLRSTPGFTLRHLRFLVIDEADRLLNQSYQDWLSQVLKAAAPPTPTPTMSTTTPTTTSTVSPLPWEGFGFSTDSLGLPLHNVTTLRKVESTIPENEQQQKLPSQRQDGPEHTSTPSTASLQSYDTHHLPHFTPFQKLLFSATLTRNPGKIASLRLFNPTYVAVSSSTSSAGGETSAAGDAHAAGSGETGDASMEIEPRYVVPTTLKEHMLICRTAGEKPMVLLHLLYNVIKVSSIPNSASNPGGGVLVFTKSVESAHRLAGLLQLYQGSSSHPVSKITASAISSDLPAQTRRRLLARFRSGEVRVLVCSDIMSRGIDFNFAGGSGPEGAGDAAGAVGYVINYDTPPRVKAYVHRCGRTARAGREGNAYTILEKREVRWFKREVLEKVGRVGVGADSAVVQEAHNKVSQYGVKKTNMEGKDLEAFEEGYRKALKGLRDIVKGSGTVGVDEDGNGEEERDEEDAEGEDEEDEEDQADEKKGGVDGEKGSDDTDDSEDSEDSEDSDDDE
ncbi:ATP-dependent RNA helicase dbp6 [Quaeritorhiza haematococci]|nr:ATP-dependent RNA helicase dbp6 [Quaeritorhiza haematococci]